MPTLKKKKHSVGEHDRIIFITYKLHSADTGRERTALCVCVNVHICSKEGMMVGVCIDEDREQKDEQNIG